MKLMITLDVEDGATWGDLRAAIAGNTPAYDNLEIAPSCYQISRVTLGGYVVTVADTLIGPLVVGDEYPRRTVTADPMDYDDETGALL